MNKKTYKFIALVFVSLVFTDCKKFEWMAGDTIRFGAGTKGGSLTRTSYGDIVSGGTKKQMIDWGLNDKIRIVCAQASTSESSNYADYSVSSVEKLSSSAESKAQLSASGSGLCWGSESDTHVFYGVYPSPAAKDGDALTAGGVLSGIIPESQPACSVSEETPYVALPDMMNQYLVAEASVTAGKQHFDDNEVFLYFTPITTAIEFEISNAMDGDLGIESIQILSNSHNLSGNFSVSLADWSTSGKTYPSLTSVSNSKKSAYVSFGDSGLTLAKEEKLTFTAFLLPQDKLDDLTFRINKTDGTYIQTALKSSADGNPFIEFDRCKKHFIKGLFVKEGAKWTLVFDPQVDSWDNTTSEISASLQDPDLSQIPSLIQWEAGETSDLNMTETPESTFTFGDGTVSKTHTFTGIPSADGITFDIISTMGVDNQDWKIKSVGGVAVGGTTYTTADGDLAVEIVSGSLKITDTRKKVSNGDNKHWTDDSAGNVWYSQSWGSENGGLNKGTVDLSKYDFKSDTPNAHSMRTANCYIIRHAGTYKIPLVYGNAIDNGTNADAYKPTIASGGSNGLTHFVNHLEDGIIINPYIENNTDDGELKWYQASYKYKGTTYPESHNNYLAADDATVVWQDNGEVIKNTSVSISGTPLTRDKTNTDATADTKYTASNVRYIEFTISQEDIRQCNALIAVKDASDNIMWSWHIWITNDPVLNNGPVTVNGTYNFLPSPCIGWIEPQMYEEKPEVSIILEQEESGETIIVSVNQELYDNFSSHGTYYQWGRKDPMRATDGDKSSDISLTVPTTIVNSILNPGVFFISNGNWCSSSFNNLWTGKYSQAPSSAVGEETGMIKTVYDPSPVGYKVPAPNAFAGIEAGTSSEITLVAVGYCDRSKGYWGDYISGYWASVAESTNAFCYAFPLRGSVTEFLTHKNRAEGLAVRPVQE